MNPNEVQHGGDHYKKAGNAQHWDMLPHCGFGWEYYIGAATKYATRVKDPVNDPKKILHFIDKLIWLVEQGLVPPEFQTTLGKRHNFDAGGRTPYPERVTVESWLWEVYFPANGLDPAGVQAQLITGLMQARTLDDLKLLRPAAAEYAGEVPPPPVVPTAEQRLEAAMERAVKVAPELGDGYDKPVITDNIVDDVAGGVIEVSSEPPAVLENNTVSDTINDGAIGTKE